jgi:DNA repair protein RadA/Sms
MPKVKTFYQCQSCGYTSPKWLGKCPDCGEWNTLVEERKETTPSRLSLPAQFRKSEPQLLSSIKAGYEQRTSTGIRELDRVLGGGVITGSVVLVGGDPGIGKSTMLLQALSGLSKYGQVLYVSGEESPEQIKIRAERLSISSDDIILFSETSLISILDTAL